MADRMRMRIALDGDIADVKVLIFHPMETGLRKDPATGELLPIHFIKTVRATHNDSLVLESQWSRAVSRNPFLNFRVRGAKSGDRISIAWEDNLGDSASIESKVA